MANNREISQFAGLVTVNDTTNNVSLGSTLFVTGASKIGISTDSVLDGVSLTVSGSGNDGGFVLIDGVAQPRLDFRSNDSSKKIYSFTNESNANRLRIGTIDGDYTNFQYIATVSAGGSFGIGLGNATPERKLDVEDSGANGTVIRSKVTTNNGGYLAYEALDSSDNQVFYVSHNGRIGADEGIIFGSDTAAANVLDDYEEGTWTPVLSVNGTDSTSTISLTGHYRKIGSMIWLSILAQQANTVPLNWNVGWTSITGSPFSRRFALIGAHGLGNINARFPLIQTYWTGGQSQTDGSIKIRSSANTSGSNNYYQTVFTFGSVNY